MARQTSTAVWLALIYAGLIVYGSLYPFTDWRIATLDGSDWLTLAMPRYRIAFDIWTNLLGYVPLGALIYLGAVRSGWRVWAAGLVALAWPAGLSYAMEVLQHALPTRVPSLLDWQLNSAGGAIGLALAALAHAVGLLRLWGGTRARWFTPDSGSALALLAVWPACLVFPSPVPLGLGPPWERSREALLGWLDGADWAAPLAQALAEIPPPMLRLPSLLEGLGTTLGLLAPIWLAYALMPRGWRRLLVVPGALALGFGGATASAALNFGPQHALTWIGPGVLPAALAAAGTGLALVAVGRRLAAALGLLTVLLMMVLVAQAPADPYFDFSLQAWERSRYVRFHGLAQWLGWLWPLWAAGWCVVRLVRRPVSTIAA